MVSERLVRLLPLLTLLGCAHADPRKFPLAAPVARDHDLDSVTLACAGSPKCAPKFNQNLLLWDAVDSTAFRPASHALRVRVSGEAVDVNALDEVPDSSFFTNRIGAHVLSPADVLAGFCAGTTPPDGQGAPGSWLIDHGKDNGQSPGFRVKVQGVRYMLKFDAEQGEQATAAAAIAARLYHAAGFWTPCDSVVYFRRDVIRIAPGLSVQFNTGSRKPLDDHVVDEELSHAPRRGALYRATASRWLPGEAIGHFSFEGTKKDDPNDVVPHEKRREVRGARLMAAWLQHFDSREQNTMATWLPDDPKQPGRGHVRHWIIDLGDSLGSHWGTEEMSRRLGYSYFFDLSYIGEDLVTLGIPQRPWDVAKTQPGVEDFGYFEAEHFDPEQWRPEYPMLPFQDLTEADGAWMARIIARFTRAHVEAAVRAGDLTSHLHQVFLVDTLLARQKRILQRYFSKLSPLTDVTVRGDELCAVDLARRTATFAGFRYGASVQRAGGPWQATTMRELADGDVCVRVPHRVQGAGVAADAVSRYVVVDVRNGTRAGPLRVHAYDLDEGLRVVGIERP